MPNCVQGFKTDRDNLAIQYSKEDIENIAFDMLNTTLPDNDFKLKYNVKDNRDWSLSKARQQIRNKKKWNDSIVKIQYRPFDVRWTLFDKTLITYPRPLIEQNFIRHANIALGIGKSGNVMGDSEWSLVSISDIAMDINVIPRGGIYLFPLYIYEGMLQYANFAPDIVKKIESITKLFMQDCHDTERSENGFLPIDLIDYIYAVLYSPSYRDTYNDFLQSDFPIIPYPNSADYFFSIAEKGKELRELHLMKTISQQDIITQYPVYDANNDNIVLSRKFVENDNDTGRVYINETQYFDNVPKDVWEMFISGYQVADKWLKDRLNKKLTNEEIIHYQKMIVAIKKTIEIQEDIDNIIRL